MTAAQRNMLKDWFRQHLVTVLTTIVIGITGQVLLTLRDVERNQIKMDARLTAALEKLGVHERESESRSELRRQMHLSGAPESKCAAMHGK